MSDDTVPAEGVQADTDVASLPGRSRRILDAHWEERGYTVPNRVVYPHQWLWDSCFHAVTWAHLGRPDRALAEVRSLFAHQHGDGFVPHMTYWKAPDLHASFWGRPGTSTITQPPMFGHAVAELVRLGVDVDPSLVRQAANGLAFLVGPRRGTRDLVPILHPWESGCDDSPRWDRWAGPGRTADSWRARKGDLVATLAFSADGSPVGNPSFEVEAASFNALVVFNAHELVAVGLGDYLSFDVEPLRDALDDRWDPLLSTWRDGSGTEPLTRTLEALLPVLVSTDEAHVDAAFAQVRSDDAFGGRCGPAQVHRDEPAYDSSAYWRGPAWPQLTYLLWTAAVRRGRDADARWLRDAMAVGVDRSGFAEYWDADAGRGLGAVPQSWAALVAIVVGAGPAGRSDAQADQSGRSS